MNLDILKEKREELNKEVSNGRLSPERVNAIISNSDYREVLEQARDTFTLELLQANAFLSPKREQLQQVDSRHHELYTAQNILKLLIETTPVLRNINQQALLRANSEVTTDNRLALNGLNLSFDPARIILGVCFNSYGGLPYLHTDANGYIVSKTLLNFNTATLSSFVLQAFTEFEKTHKLSIEKIPDTPEHVHFFWLQRRLVQIEDIVLSVFIKEGTAKQQEIEKKYGFNIAPIGMLLDAAWGIQKKHIDAFNLTLNALNSPNLKPVMHYLNYMEAKARAKGNNLLNS